MSLSDEQAERALLGAVLADNAVLSTLSDLVEPEDCASTAHAQILAGMLELDRRRRPIDHLTLSEELKRRGQLGEVGGPSYLMGLDEAVPVASNARQYAEIVREYSFRRRLIRAGKEICAQAGDLSRKAEDVFVEGMGKISAAGSRGRSRGGWRHGEELLQEELDRIERIHAGQDEHVQFVKTGIEPWDDAIGGLAVSVITFVVAQPSVGKTALTASLAFSLSERGEKVGVLSLEDSAGAYQRRLIADSTGFRIRDLMTRGSLTQDELLTVWDKSAGQHARVANLWIDDERHVNARRAAAKIRQKRALDGTRVFLVDHMMELHDWESEQARDAAVHMIVATLRDVAIEERVAILLNAHLRDTQDKFRDERNIKPKLQDIVGGRAAEQKARYVVGLWEREPPKEPEPPKPLAKPKPPKKATPEEMQALEEAHAEATKKQQLQYEKKHREWETKVCQARDYVIASVLKANEGDSGFDFPLKRIKNAGLVSKEAHRG